MVFPGLLFTHAYAHAHAHACVRVENIPRTPREAWEIRSTKGGKCAGVVYQGFSCKRPSGRGLSPRGVDSQPPAQPPRIPRKTSSFPKSSCDTSPASPATHIRPIVVSGLLERRFIVIDSRRNFTQRVLSQSRRRCTVIAVE